MTLPSTRTERVTRNDDVGSSAAPIIVSRVSMNRPMCSSEAGECSGRRTRTRSPGLALFCILTSSYFFLPVVLPVATASLLASGPVSPASPVFSPTELLVRPAFHVWFLDAGLDFAGLVADDLGPFGICWLGLFSKVVASHLL